MFYIDINNRFTAIVTDYMAKGYTINTRTMSGSQGDFAHIDLTDGTEVIRIMVDTFHEWSDISLDGLEIVVGRANSEVVPNSDNDCRALWNNELDIISRERFYEIGIDRRHKKFYGTHEQAVAAQQMKFQRYTSKNQGRETQTITPKATVIAKRVIRRQFGVKRICEADVKISKFNGVYTIGYKEKAYRLR